MSGYTWQQILALAALVAATGYAIGNCPGVHVKFAPPAAEETKP